MRKIFTIVIAMTLLSAVSFSQAYHKASGRFIKSSKITNTQVNPVVRTRATTAVFFEDDFEGADLAAKGWTTNNADGDAHDWRIAGVSSWAHTGAECVASASYDNTDGALTPDNWLISPVLDLSSAAGNVTLEYWVGGTDASYYNENYALYVSTTGTAVTDFVDTIFTTVLDQNAYKKISIDLSSYAGTSIYFAFRHFDVTDEYNIIIDDLVVYENMSIDGGVTAVIAPVHNGNCSLTATENITTSIFNYGGQPISNFNVSYSIDGAAAITETVTDTISPATSFDYTFTATADLSVVGYHTIDITLSVTGDSITDNDTYSYSIMNGDNYITVSGHAPDGHGGYAWYIVNSADDTVGFHEGYTWNTDFSNDVCINSSDCYHLVFLAGPSEGMGTDGNFVVVYNNDTIGGSATVGNQTTDNVVEYLGTCAPVYNAAVIGIDPINTNGNCTLTATEDITIHIVNMANGDLTGFNVNYRINEGTNVTETFTGTILQGDTAEYIFTTKADLSEVKHYTIEAWSVVAGDTISSNDSTSVLATHGDAIITMHMTCSDAYGYEAYYMLFDAADTSVVAFGGPAVNTADSLTAGVEKTFDVCAVSTKCYFAVIADTYGDGGVSFSVDYESEQVGEIAADGYTEQGIIPFVGGGCPSTDATLSDLLVDATTVAGFASDVYSYDVVLPFGTITVPTVTYVLNDVTAAAVVNDAAALPGSTTVVVTSEAGTQITYTVNFQVSVGVDDLSIASINIYPNPSTGVFNVANAENSTIEVLDIFGKTISTINSTSNMNTIDMSTYANGTYIVKVTTNNAVIIKKINLVK